MQQPRRVYATGAPSIATQLAGQVRSSSGATYAPGRASDGPLATAAVTAGLQDDALLRELTDLARCQLPFPKLTVIACTLGAPWDADLVAARLDALARSKRILMWQGSPQFFPGQRIICVRGGSFELRTVSAPAHIHVAT